MKSRKPANLKTRKGDNANLTGEMHPMARVTSPPTTLLLELTRNTSFMLMVSIISGDLSIIAMKHSLASSVGKEHIVPKI